MSSYFVAIESVTHPYPKDDAGRTSRPTTCASQAPADILVDGVLSYMFGSRISEWYFEHLLKGRIRRSLLRWDVPGWPGACFTSQESGSEIPVFHEHHPAPARLLDYDVRRLRGTIVPQALWGPQGQGATKKYVLDATLQWPVFFIREDHTVGLSLQEAVEGPRQALLGAQTRAQLGERSTLHVRIKVRTTRTFSQSLFLLGQGSRSLELALLTCVPLQWPGYGVWKRQRQARDDTQQKNPITLAKFAQQVGRCVGEFLRVCFTEPQSC